jgi:predicted double-glycine peptidase
MLKIKPFRQTPGYCGPASLKMVLEYYGFKMGEQELAKISGTTKGEGVSAQGLVSAAKKLGFDAYIKKNATLLDIKKLISRKIPPIVNWFSFDDGHYSVVAGIDGKNITMMDPQLSKVLAVFVRRRVLDLETFYRIWFDFPKNFIKKPEDLILRLMIVITPKKK